MGDLLMWLVTAVIGFFAGRDTAKVPIKKVPAAVVHLPAQAASHLVDQVGTSLLQLVEHVVFAVGLVAIIAALFFIAWRHRPGRVRLGTIIVARLAECRSDQASHRPGRRRISRSVKFTGLPPGQARR
ncbi:MAG TPA: hypothetical protein VME19_15035 [Streptosporangiaceae bacterium]|nr:hypothetical protein [Streptosporangiaceae bacterium]